MMDSENKLGSYIKLKRKLLGKSTQQLANETGLSRTGISYIELGVRTGSKNTLTKIACSLDIDPEKLLEFQNIDDTELQQLQLQIDLNKFDSTSLQPWTHLIYSLVNENISPEQAMIIFTKCKYIANIINSNERIE